MNHPPPEPPRQAVVTFHLTPIGRRRKRLDPASIVVVLVVALLLVAVVRPWQVSAPASAVVPSPGRSGRAPGPSLVPGDRPPASPQGSGAPPPLADLARNIRDMALMQGPYGVGVGAAVGPPLQPTLEIPAVGVATDEAWWAWIVVGPVTATPAPGGVGDAIERLPPGKLCGGVPDLPTGGRILVVTTSSGAAIPGQLKGWHEVGWHDEPRDIEPLAFNGLVMSRSGDVSYLELAGGQAWPDGRYEFGVDGSSGTNLTVCLGHP